MAEDERLVEVGGVDDVVVGIFRHVGNCLVVRRGDDYGVFRVHCPHGFEHFSLHVMPVLVPISAVRLVEEFVNHFGGPVLAVLGNLEPYRLESGLRVRLFVIPFPDVVIHDDVHSVFLRKVDCLVKTVEEGLLELVCRCVLDEIAELHRDSHNVDADGGEE